MKKIIIALTVLFCAAQGLQAQKVGFVNRAKIIDTLPLKDSADLKLQQKAAEYEAILMEKEEEYNKKKAELDRKKATPGTSEIMINLDAQTLQRIAQDYQSSETAINQELQSLQAQLLKPILAQIDEAVGVIAKQKGYTSVIDNSSEIVIYIGNKSDDLTDAVIAHMLAQKPGTASTAPKK